MSQPVKPDRISMLEFKIGFFVGRPRLILQQLAPA